MDFFTLDAEGAALAVAMGIAVYLLGGVVGYYFVGVMVLFLALAAVVTNVRIEYKRRMGISQVQRGVMNVLANGTMPLMMAAIYFAFGQNGMPKLAALAIIGFTASVAAVTADKFSSELGVLGGAPRQIMTMKRVKRGVSGGVTALGFVVGLLASLVVAMTIVAVFPYVATLRGGMGVSLGMLRNAEFYKAVASIAIGGFAGDFVDSLLGYYEEMGIGNKFSSNFVCSAAGGVVAMVLFVLL